MAEPAKQSPDETRSEAAKAPVASDPWRPLDTLRRQVDRLFEEFGRPPAHFPFGRSTFDIEPLWKRGMPGHSVPAVDITEKDAAFEMTVELPGMEEKDVQIKLANGNLVISGEKKEEKEESRKDYHLSERHFGAFQRIFSLPENVDPDRIEASFHKGVLAISLPKRPEAAQPEKRIPVKSVS